MRTVLVLAIVSVALLGIASTNAGANTVGVGKCSDSGACASVCVDGTTACPGGALACVGISFEVPLCLPGSLLG
jgi:hypothetical protein